jgi:hypothetical protein
MLLRIYRPIGLREESHEYCSVKAGVQRARLALRVTLSLDHVNSKFETLAADYLQDMLSRRHTWLRSVAGYPEGYGHTPACLQIRRYRSNRSNAATMRPGSGTGVQCSVPDAALSGR